MMGRGKRASALSSAVAAARVAVAPRLDPRVAVELGRTLTARATASSWIAMVIIPFTIIAYDGAYFPKQLPQGVIAAAAADALIVLLLIGLRQQVFERYPWLPFALLAGVIANFTEAANLLLTGGTDSDFVFPYYLIFFAISVFFPAPLPAVIATAGLLPLGYLAVALAENEPLGAKHFISNLMLLIDSALITGIGNRVVTNLFLREVKLRIDQEAQAYAHSLELQLEVDVEPGGPYVWSGDERHLDRIVLNLVSNACKFSRPGGLVRGGVGSD